MIAQVSVPKSVPGDMGNLRRWLSTDRGLPVFRDPRTSDTTTYLYNDQYASGRVPAGRMANGNLL